ncbi:T9SS type A sorting domain-containing protein [Aequorivita viscosa]|nr:T9SS type A sorting domain-containing protein [Aequorivita viscosa]
MIKNALYIVAGLGLSFYGALAQTPTFEWAKSIGAINYDYCYDVEVDGSGNVFTTGYFQGTVDFDPGPAVFNLTTGRTGAFVSKIDPLGNLVWAKALTGTYSTQGNTLVLGETGSVYISGSFKGTTDFDPGSGVYNLTAIGENNNAFVCKLDALGNFVWAKQIGGQGYCSGLSIALDQSANEAVYITGNFIGTVDFNPNVGVFNLSSVGDKTDIFVFKLDTNGAFVWAKQIGGTGLKSTRQIIIDPDENGAIYTVGWFDGTVDFDPDITTNFNLTSVANYDIFISKLNSSGDFIWAKQLGGPGFNKGMAIALDPTGTGDIYLTGAFQQTVDFDPGVAIFNLHSAGDFDIFIAKLNSSGNFVWAKAMGGPSYQYGFSIALDLLGNIYTTGYFRGNCDFNPDPSATYFLNAPGNDEIFVSKLNNTGNFVWAKQILGTGDDYGLSLTLNISGELFMTGAFFSPTINFDAITLTNSFGGGYTCDLFLAKLNSDTAGIEDAEKIKNFMLYPNPVTENLYLLFPHKEQKVAITITDLTGKLVKAISLTSNPIYVGHLPSGVYFINVESENTTSSQKFIKQ